MPDSLDTLSDEALAAQASEGSSACFEVLVLRYERRVLSFLLRSLRRADAEDVLQDTFASAYLKLHRYDNRWRFKTWLFTIAQRHAIDLLRRKRPSGNVDDLEPAVHDDPAHHASSRDLHGRVWSVARSVLDEEPYRALWLHYAEEMGTQEIAKVMNRSWVWVKTALHRARRKLAPHLARLEGHDASTLKAGDACQTT